MFKGSLRSLLVAVAVVGLAAGCTSTKSGIGTDNGRVGSNPDGLSPQAVYEPPTFKRIVWWNVGSFESVPESMEAAGREFCGCQDTDSTKHVAIGYHPLARGTDGLPIKGGGFLCVATANR
jgi:hypothetical protein